MFFLAGEWVPAWLEFTITFAVALLGVAGYASPPIDVGAVARRFSTLAFRAMAVIVLAGLALTFAYVAIRRGMPSRPSVCMIRKVPLNPMNSVQKFHSPSLRLSNRPVIFGNQ